jgi:hypothetical protein
MYKSWFNLSQCEGPEIAFIRSMVAIDAVGTVLLDSCCLSCGLLESLQDIGYQILSILDTAAHTYKIVKDTNRLTLIPRDASMGHAAGHLDKTLDTT